MTSTFTVPILDGAESEGEETVLVGFFITPVAGAVLVGPNRLRSSQLSNK